MPDFTAVLAVLGGAFILFLIVITANPGLRARARDTFRRALPHDGGNPAPGSAAVAPAADLRPEVPYEVPRLPAIYTNIRYLGSGGFAVVYAAFDTSLGRDVAVKVVRYDSENTMSFLRGMEREVRLLRRVRRTVAMPKFIRADLDWVRPHYAMEYIEGSNLNAYVQARGPITAAAEVATVFDTVEALVELQELGIAHRDITPKNVMMAGDRTALIDLGIGREMDSDSTRTAALTGVAAYVAPEVVVHGPDRVTFTSEVYSWGATLGFAVTGFRRHRDITDAALGRCDPAYLAALAEIEGSSPWHRELVKLIENCTRMDPGDRVADAEDLTCVTKALRSMIRMGDLGQLTPGNAANVLAKRTIRNVSDQVFARALEGFDREWDSRAHRTFLDDPVNLILKRLERLYATRELLHRGVSAPFLYGLIIEGRDHVRHLDDILVSDSHLVPSKWVKSLAEVGIPAEQTKDGLIRVR